MDVHVRTPRGAVARVDAADPADWLVTTISERDVLPQARSIAEVLRQDLARAGRFREAVGHRLRRDAFDLHGGGGAGDALQVVHHHGLGRPQSVAEGLVAVAERLLRLAGARIAQIANRPRVWTWASRSTSAGGTPCAIHSSRR